MSSPSTNQPEVSNYDKWVRSKAASTTRGSQRHPEVDSIHFVMLDFFFNRSIHSWMNRYHSEDLSKMVIQWTESSHSCAVESDLLKHFQARLPSSTRSEILPLLQKWYNVFDTVFFQKSLGEDFQIDIFAAKTWAESHKYGSFAPEDRKIYINLKPRGTRNHGFRGNAVEWYLSNLLHEMLHAFFWKFHCVCQDCHSSKAASNGGLGATDHGPPWIQACRALETTLRELTP